MEIEPGQVAVVRFPNDQTPIPAVALVRAIRGELALVSKHRGRLRTARLWAKPRWVPATDVVREATAREANLGIVIDPLPPRAVAA